jgi:hypothetical protein
MKSFSLQSHSNHYKVTIKHWSPYSVALSWYFYDLTFSMMNYEILDFEVFLFSTENGKRGIMDSVAALNFMVFSSIFPFHYHKILAIYHFVTCKFMISLMSVFVQSKGCWIRYNGHVLKEKVWLVLTKISKYLIFSPTSPIWDTRCGWSLYKNKVCLAVETIFALGAMTQLMRF